MSISDLQNQTNANIQAKANLIWEIATHLVGLFKPHEYGKVILPMTVLKRFDDALKPTKNAVVEMSKKLDAQQVEGTTLEGSTDLNRVYDLRNKIRDLMLYNFDDVETFNKYMKTQSGKEQDAVALGKLSGMFRPVIARYMELNEDERYTARDYVKKFNKAYAFVTQLVRLHDRDLFNEYQYTLHLVRLLPKVDDETNGNIEDKIKLEYASLTESFRGAFVPGGSTAPKVPSKKKDTLQSIIDKANERFSGNFTDADRVIIEGIYQMFMKDNEVKKFRKYAKDNSTEMFVRSLFPDKFRDIVTQCFMDNNDSFAKLFNDPDFYQKVQEAMAQELYRALRKD